MFLLLCEGISSFILSPSHFSSCAYCCIAKKRMTQIISTKKSVSRCSLASTATSTQHSSKVPKVEISSESIKDSVHSSSWIQRAASNLETYGVCALSLLSSSNDKTKSDSSSLISSELCDSIHKISDTRLTQIFNKIENRGIDTRGIEDGPFRFMEVVCRDQLRYDLPATNCGTPWLSSDKVTMGQFQNALDKIVEPIMKKFFHNNNVETCRTGYIVSHAGSHSQDWHRDGPDPGFINCFVPLIDLKEDLGPTSLMLQSHINHENEEHQEKKTIKPLLNKGEILLFDYRTLHRGEGNFNEHDITRTLAYSVYVSASSITSYGDGHNFPDALTLEFD